MERAREGDERGWRAAMWRESPAAALPPRAPRVVAAAEMRAALERMDNQINGKAE